MTDDEPDGLLARLRRMSAEAGPVPGHVVDSAKAALSLRRLDAELAELVADSAVAAGAVRGPGETVRLLAFEAGEAGVELQVEQIGATVTIRGVATGVRGRVVVESPGGDTAAPIDADGWFVVAGVPAGPTRVRFTTADGVPVVTSWVLT